MQSSPLQRGVNALRIAFAVIAVICLGLFAVHWHEIAGNDRAHWTMHMMQFVFGAAALGAAGIAALAWLWLWYLRRG